MKSIFSLLLSPASMLCFAACPGLAQDGSGGEGLPSPYFVAGFRCEGLKTGNADLYNLLSAGERSDLDRFNLERACENLFAAYGIEKFKWISPDEIERLQMLLAGNPAFDRADLRLLPAEERGHVYLIAQVVRREGAQWRISSEVGLHEFSDPSERGVSGNLEVRRRVFENGFSVSELGVRATSRHSALDVMRIPASPREDLPYGFGSKTQWSAALIGSSRFELSDRWFATSNVEIEIDNWGLTEGSRVTFDLGAGLAYHLLPRSHPFRVSVGPTARYLNAQMKMNAQESPLLARSTYQGDTHDVFMLGVDLDMLFGNRRSSYLAFRFQAEMAPDRTNSHSRSLADLQYVLIGLGNTALGAEFSREVHRKTLSSDDLDRTAVDEEGEAVIKLGIAIPSQTHHSEIMLRGGVAYAGEPRDSDLGWESESPLVGVGYKYFGRTLELALNAAWYFERTF